MHLRILQDALSDQKSRAGGASGGGLGGGGIIGGDTAGLAERLELALESLVEFCREPALMLDL